MLSVPVETEYCQLCRFPLVLLKIRTPAEHIQKCKARKLPQARCSEGIYCQSKMESHYQLFAHEDLQHSKVDCLKAENLNNNSNIGLLPPLIDLTDSQNSEDFVPAKSPRNRSNFLNLSQINKSKNHVPLSQSRKRKVSKSSSTNQTKKPLLDYLKTENESFSQNSTQTPFTIARQQRRNSQQRKSKLMNYDSIDLTKDGSSDEQNSSLPQNRSNLWKLSRIINDSSSSETDRIGKSSASLHRLQPLSRPLKQPVISRANSHSMANNIEMTCTLSKGHSNSLASKSDHDKRPQNLKHSLNPKKSAIPPFISVKGFVDSPSSISGSTKCLKSENAATAKSHVSVSETNHQINGHVFHSTQAYDNAASSTQTTTSDSLDSENFSTSPDFLPMTPIIQDKNANHGIQLQSDEEEDFFSMSPLDKSSEEKFVDTCSDQVDFPTRILKSDKKKEKNSFSKSPMEVFSHTESNVDGDESSTRKESDGARHDLQVDFNKPGGSHSDKPGIPLAGSLDETVLCPDKDNPLTSMQPVSSVTDCSNAADEKAQNTKPQLSPQHVNHMSNEEIEQSSKQDENCIKNPCQSFEMPTADAGLSFSESDQEDRRSPGVASADTAPFISILKDRQRNSLCADKKVPDDALIDRMDSFECSSVLLHPDSRSFQSSNISIHGDNNTDANFEEGQSWESEKGEKKISRTLQHCEGSKCQDTNQNSPSSSNVTQTSVNKSASNRDSIPSHPAPALSQELSKTAQGQAADDLLHSGTNLHNKPLTGSRSNLNQSKNFDLSSPLPESFLLDSPKDVRVVQRHPTKMNESVLKCSRALVFDESKVRGNHLTDNKLKAHCLNMDSCKETGKLDKSVTPKMPTDSRNMSTARTNSHAKSVELSLPNDDASACGNASTSIVDEGYSRCRTVTGYGENDNSLSNSAKSNLYQQKLKVHSNVENGGSSSVKSSFDTLEDSKGRRRKQGDIGAMLFGMKPKIRKETAQHEKRGSYRKVLEGNAFKPRKCPFYKKIAGTDIVVDAFSYGPVPGINLYFLSHFHFDHYMGLEKRKWKEKIFCGHVTGNLLAGVLKIPEHLIIRLPLWEEIPISDVHVTLLDANHCPGAVLFLFKLKNNNCILHTGDFRAIPEMEGYSALSGVKVSTLHLDTTYLNPEYCFPPQSVVIEVAVAIVRKSIQECQKSLIVVGSYDIGKERIFCSIAKALKSKIHVVPRKMNILKRLLNEEIEHLVTTKSSPATKVHVVPMRLLNIKQLESMLSKHCFFKQIVAIKPTGWTQGGITKVTGDLSQIRPTGTGNVKIYNLPYSEHSSFDELRQFVQFLKPKRVIPTVNVGQAEIRNMMNIYLNKWKDGEDVCESDNPSSR